MKKFRCGLFKANMKKISLVIIAFILITGIMTLMNATSIGNYMVGNGESRYGLKFAPLVLLGYTFLSVGCYWMNCCLFGFLMKRNESDFYGVLPYKRKTVFRKNMIAMYAVIVFILIVDLLILFVAGLCARSYVVIVWKGSFKYILASVVAMLLITNVTAFAMSCSGNLRTAFLMTVMLLFGPRLLLINVTRYGNLENDVMNIVQFVRILNPDLNLISRVMFRTQDYTILGPDSIQNISLWESCVYTAILSIIYYILGERAYVKRDSEIAGTGGVGPVTYYFNKIFLGVLIMLIPICSNVTGPEIKNYYGYNWAQVFVFVLITMLAMWFYDGYIGRKMNRLKSLLYSTVAVCACSLIIVGTMLGIKKYEWNYKLDPDKIEGFNKLEYYYYDDGNRKIYAMTEWVKPDKEVAKIIADAFERQRNKVYIKDEEGDLSYEDEGYDSMRIRYAGKNILINVCIADDVERRKVLDAFYLSETYKDAVYYLPEKITSLNGVAIGKVNYEPWEVKLDSKAYKTFRNEYYKLYEEYKRSDRLKKFNAKSSGISIGVESVLDGYLNQTFVYIQKDDYPETYAYVWKQFVEKQYDSYKKYLLSQSKDVSVRAYADCNVKDEERVKITYDQLLEILETKDKEPKHMYTVLVGNDKNPEYLYISSPVELKPYTD